MTVTLSLPVLLGLASGATVTGFVFGVAAMLRPRPLPPIQVRLSPAPAWGELAPFPDTGPLLIWSDMEAAKRQLGADVDGFIGATAHVDAWIDDAEAIIPPRWR